ncbi:hypothetical protein M8C21_009086 [Ambrosia artemisiifolia]|uniref:Glutamate receptor n=1 Tax=Ambrosia artemisiifolia TaxID=4212 RepID=A0AAD5GC24_AMBAR|nr:hypothetical protein M8C21_009086 [Ambrosia artemisiifolia]
MFCFDNNTTVSTRPDVVNIASILTFDSIIGKVAKIALQAAIEDVNADPTILKGTKLNITLHDANYSGFLSMMEALLVMESDAVALIGPQSSVVAHVISHMANELQVPLLSFTATDPTLSSLQYPFFVRTTHRDQLAARGCKISYKAPIKPQATKKDISDVLIQVALMESRVLVVHAYADWGLDILEVAKSLQMLDSGYVWIATNWLSTVIDITSPLPFKTFDVMQGLLTLRSYTKESDLKRKFAYEWRKLTTSGLSTYCLYAYDTVWLLARALDAYFDQGGNISFSKDIRLNELKGKMLNLDSLRIFNAHPLSSSEALHSVIWPGQRIQKPRGWVFPENGRQLVIGVPHRVSFTEFVGQSNDTNAFEGYCIDVFTSAVNLLPYAVPYKFQSYGDRVKNPSYIELLSLVNAGVYDAAVGDIAITTNRTRLADFSQPFIESGLVVVAPVWKSNSSTWAFLRPFSPLMWCVSGIFFILVGAVVWTLEHRINDEFRGPPKKQIVTALWFSFSTIFFSHRENTLSALGRMVLILWLFVVMILNSSYTASLTSILTVQKLYSPVKGIDSLMASKEPIGYQENSYVGNYLTAEYSIHKDRLIPLSLPEDIEKALKDGPIHGGVAAVVVERAYAELFLSTRCDFSIVGQEFTKNGWGFAFPRDSPLAADMSTAILKLSESGKLQRIHDKWLLRSACSSQGTRYEVDQLGLASFKGLFLIFGMACFLALIIYLALTTRQFYKHHPDLCESTGRSNQSPLKKFISFVDEKEETTKARSKSKCSEGSSSKTYASSA